MPNVREILKNGIEKLEELFSKAREKTSGVFRGLKGRISPAWGVPGMIALCVVLALILGVLVMVLIRERPGGRKAGSDLSDAFKPLNIPPEDFFLPEEPDFLPKILYEREKREFWTGEDVRPYWTDPLEYGSEPWVEGVRSAVDELLERVP